MNLGGKTQNWLMVIFFFLMVIFIKFYCVLDDATLQSIFSAKSSFYCLVDWIFFRDRKGSTESYPKSSTTQEQSLSLII